MFFLLCWDTSYFSRWNRILRIYVLAAILISSISHLTYALFLIFNLCSFRSFPTSVLLHLLNIGVCAYKSQFTLYSLHLILSYFFIILGYRMIFGWSYLTGTSRWYSQALSSTQKLVKQICLCNWRCGCCKLASFATLLVQEPMSNGTFSLRIKQKLSCIASRVSKNEMWNHWQNAPIVHPRRDFFALG
jgi:hypothetical protein